jgi:hypothetical protein
MCDTAEPKSSLLPSQRGHPHLCRDREPEPSSVNLSSFLVGCTACAIGGVASAQPNVAGRELVGAVRAPGGVPVEGAIIEIHGVSTRSDSRGAFRLYTSNVDTVTLAIRRLGYAPVSALLTARNRQWDTVVVEMDPVPQELAAVKASAAKVRLGLRDFDERRALGAGQFYTRDDIVKRNTAHTSDILRDARGVRLVRLRSGGYGVRFAAFSTGRGGCTPNLWIDGQLVPGAEVDDVTATDLEAIELYENWTSTPQQFSKGTALPCGTIVLWTRVPGSR